MSAADSIILAEPRQPARAGSLALSFWIGLLSLVPIAALTGSMAFLMMVLACCLAARVWFHPQEATSAGILFLIACNVFFPSSARYDWSWRDFGGEMYYWAAGVLVITLAAVIRIGIRSLLRVPHSVKAIALVAVVSTAVGFAHGNAPSYVIRQLYGSLLLVTYFAIAFRDSDEELFLRRLRTFGLLCAAGFFVYYAAEFSEYGFHKEITSLGTLEGSLAILCFAKGLTEKRLGWMVSAVLLLAVPLLLFERRVLVAFAVAVPLALAIKTSSKRVRFVCVLVALLGILPAILPSGADFVLQGLKGIPGVEQLLPSGGADVYSLMERAIQLDLAVLTLRGSPILGDGLGAEIGWETPTGDEFKQQAYIDNGWAYVAVKMGGLGILAFGWFLVTTLRCVSRNALALSACLLSACLVTMFSEPVFFNFNTSALLGALAGLLCAKNARTLGAEVTRLSPRSDLGFQSLQRERI
jgi:hypothetical protein